MFLRELFFSLWFFLPVGIANCSPIFAAKIPILQKWSYPLDCYLTFRGKRILGNHKTIRGLVIGIIFGIVTSYLLLYLYKSFPFITSLVTINYQQINPSILGFLSAVGALGGDITKSFIKRQYGIASGHRWFPFDQIDYIVGGIIATSLIVQLTFFEYILIILVWFCLHIASSKIGYFLKLKNVPY